MASPAVASPATVNEDKNYLTVTDSLTNTTIKIPIHPLNYIPASAFTALRITPTTPPRATPGDTVPVRLYDPGFKNTVVCRSKVSMVDGERGKLYYRGYDVETLCEKSSFLEVAFLLIYGELPSKTELADWTRAIMHHTYLHTELEKQMMTFRYDAHPMGTLIATIASLSTFHPEANPALQGDSFYMKPKPGPGKTELSPEEAIKAKKAQDARNKAIFRMLGKVPTIAANAYRNRIGRSYNHPMPNCNSYAENFLYMLDKDNEPDYKPDPRLVTILDKMFILLAEHGSNCSTVMMRHLASSGVDPYTALSGSAGALFGERKGSAVISMLKQIGTVENIQVFLSLVKRKQCVVAGPNGTLIAAPDVGPNGVRARPTRLQGFGHRIYKTVDPRVKTCKALALELFNLIGKGDLGDLALALEEAALSDPWFREKGLFPNIDYWSPIAFHTMGFPPDMFPVLNCVPRTAGYIAHWQESLDDPEYKIYRPRQIYIGEVLREFPNVLEEREQLRGDGGEPHLETQYSKSLSKAAKKRMSVTVEELKLAELNELIEKTQRSIEGLSLAISEEDETKINEPPVVVEDSDIASRLALGPVSTWVVKKLFPTSPAATTIAPLSPASENAIRGSTSTGLNVVNQRIAKTQGELQELLNKQRELVTLYQQRQASASSMPDVTVESDPAPASAAAASSSSRRPSTQGHGVGTGKKEPDLLAGSRSPRVIKTDINKMK
ncbi:hypothetical protein HDU76_002945 [Blyttiomyces sp. JEL0837]|nr:hypothetical protein HDU76_002945 [Blyttiomyces sp. JEL0837]